MDREQLFEYVKKQYNIEPDYPWHDENAVLRHKSNNKWFGAILEVEKTKLGMEEDGRVYVLNLKCDPLFASYMKGKSGYHPAYHMNKEKWISIRLDGSVPQKEIVNALAISFDMTE